ncbi:MAG: DinB family protein [Candidatus Acidiferrales bacterium]
MQETVQGYKKRILGYVAGQKPLKVQAETPKKLERLLKGVPRGRLVRRPEPSKWCVAEIVAHLAETELVGGYRVRTILGAPGTPIQAFDQDKWAEAGKYSKRNPKDSLALFRALREANLALLKSLSPEQWKHSGFHAERGEESVENIVEMFAGHDINHLSQIEKIVGKSTRR